MKKTISLLLVLIMSFSCFSFVSFAKTTKTAEHLTEVPEGYIGIYTVEDLYFVRNDLTANYILMNDIDLSEATAPNGDFSFMSSGWEPIGSNNSYGEEAFSGIFDGNGFTIYGMNITVCKPADITEKVNIGLFAKNSGEIKNLLMRDCFISADIVVPSQYKLYAGFIVAQNTGSIENCVVINSNITVNECFTYVRAGGISGLNNGFITSSSFWGLVDIYASGRNTNEKAYAYAGGISGSNINGTIEKCINLGEIKSAADGIGGLNSVGHHWYEPGYYYSGGITAVRGTIKNCYNKGKINDSYGAGISYDADSIINCYSVGNSGYAISSSTVENSYYIVGAGSSCNGAIERTDFLMQQINSYNNWDFDTVWTMEGREDYPYPELRDVPLILPEDLNHKHEYTSEVTKEATHIEDGETTYTCECGDTYTETVAKIEEHTYNAVVTTPTCTEKGFTTYTCECGDTYISDYVVATGHSYNAEITTEPTHLTEGVKTFTCKCGDSYTEPVAKLTEHTYTSEVTKEATHLAEGETTYTCECGDTYTEVIAKLTAHTYDKVVTEPTCTEKGYTIYTCECGDTYTEEIAAIGHKELVIPSVEATCTDEGLSAGKICEACGEDLASQQIIPAKGHKFSSWIVISEVTCDTNGRKVRICACGAVEEDVENSYGHNDADCDDKCDNCDENLKTEVTVPVEKDNVFTFLKSFLNNLIEFFRQLLGLKK